MIVLPWPDLAALSPNSRTHWRALASAKKRYRQACYLSALAQRANKLRLPKRDDIAVLIEFCPPDRRKRDRDNCLSAIKAGLDGLCDALGIDDSRFEPVTVSMGHVTAGGEVRVTLAEAGRASA